MRLEQPGQPEEVLLLVRPGCGVAAELPAVEEHPVERGLGPERLEGELVIRCVFAGLGRSYQSLLGRPEIALGRRRPTEDVVTLDLHLGGVLQQQGHRWQEHRGRLATTPGADEPPHGLREEQRGGRRGRIDTDRQARDVDALGDHPNGHHPALLRLGELLDARAGTGVVGQHHHRRLAGDVLQDAGVGPSRRMVRGDHQPARIGYVPTHLGQPPVGRVKNRRDPLTGGVERCPPGLRGEVLGQRLPQRGLHLVTGPRAPAHRAGVGQEHHRSHDTVAQGLGVAVRVVGDAAERTVTLGGVRHERDRVDVGAERRAGERQSPGRGQERVPGRLAPGARVTCVVDLVEDDEGPPGLGAPPVQRRVSGDLGVRDRDAAEVAAHGPVGVAELGVKRDADLVRRLGPLALEVLGGGDDGDGLDLAPLEQVGSHPQGERGLTGAGRGYGEEVTRVRGAVGGDSLLLPGAQRARSAPRRTSGERG